MTNRDIFTTILHEVTGRPKGEFSALITHMQAQFPGQGRWDEELPPDKAERLLTALRAEKSGILNWILGIAPYRSAQNGNSYFGMNSTT
jgi:hypothetical protein